MLFLHWGYATTYPFAIALWVSKLPLYVVLHQKRGMGYRKKMRENKRAKSSSVQRERERKRKVAMPSQKEAREGKLPKYTPHMHLLINLYDLLLLVIQVFDLAMYSIQVSYAFTLYLELHISFRIEIKAKIHGLGEDFKHHWVTWVYHLRNLGKFSFQNLWKTSRKFELNQSRQKVSIYLRILAIACVKVKAISPTLLRLMVNF